MGQTTGNSLGLNLYLRLASRGGSKIMPAGPNPRPDGSYVWLHADQDNALKSLVQLTRRMHRERNDLCFLITVDGDTPPDMTGFPDGTIGTVAPPDRPRAVRDFLDHWRPAAVLPTGTSFRPALIHEAHRRGIPVILLNARMSQAEFRKWNWRLGIGPATLARVTLILAQDHDSARWFQRLAPNIREPEVTGRIEETTDPLPANESDREALAALLTARSVWLAVQCPPDEQEMVLAAHAQAMRLAHRMLLILVPSDPGQSAALSEAIEARGWTSALWSRGQEPDPEVQVFVADTEGELGLWYRLAPVTYMGGTLTGHGGGRNPFEPAALGSAILHGPHLSPYPEGYLRLRAARAAREVATPEALAAAVCDLIAPDKAAQLAHDAWQVSSGGAEVTERVLSLIFAAMDHPEARSALQRDAHETVNREKSV